MPLQYKAKYPRDLLSKLPMLFPFQHGLLSTPRFSCPSLVWNPSLFPLLSPTPLLEVGRREAGTEQKAQLFFLLPPTSHFCQSLTNARGHLWWQRWMKILAHGPSTYWPPVYSSHWDQANQMVVYKAITQSFSCTGVEDMRFHQEHN